MRVLVCLLLILSAVANVPAQSMDRYATQLLQRIAEQTNLKNQLDTLSNDGIYFDFTQYKGKPVSVIVRANRVEHIGFSIFSLAQREALHSPVYNFIERYALEMELPREKTISIKRQQELDNVVFSKGSISLLPSFFRDTTLSFSLSNHDERLYELKWSRDEETICHVFFPSNYELLHGSRLIENEDRMRSEIERFTDTTGVRTIYPIENVYKVDSTNYYVLDLGYNRIPQIANKRYLKMNSDSINGRDSLVVLCNQQYPVETVANLFSTLDIPNKYSVEIRQSKYNLEEEQFCVPLYQLVGFCLSEGCKPYFGLLNYDETSNYLDAVVMMRNHEQAYEHLLRIKMDTSTLSVMQGKISVKIMGYIMTHNVKQM